MSYRPMPSSFEVKIVGVSFLPKFPDNLYKLEEIAAENILNDPFEDFGSEMEMKPIPALLVRNPQNKFDENAIECHVPCLGPELAMIGHLPAGVAERLAPDMDTGDGFSAEVKRVLIHPDHPENPGILLQVVRS